MSKQDENMFGTAAWDAFNDENDNVGIDEDFGPELESDKVKVVNTPIQELKSSAQTLLRLDIDRSGSMGGFVTAMEQALKLVKDSIITSEEAPRIQISKTLFADTVDPEGYTDVEKFDTSYSVNSGLTKLYDSIIDSERRIRQYREDLKNNGVSVKAVLCILSDGIDNDSIASFEDAKESIAKMQNDDVTVCYIAFGSDNCEKLAQDLGVTNVVKTDATVHDLHKIMKFVSVGTIKKSQGNAK